jgi:hypothetical protein
LAANSLFARGNQEADMEEERTTTQARQGVTGQGVRQVLALSLGGAVLAMTIVWLMFFV